MEPQKLFMANILQGAIDAHVVTLEDLFRHIPAEVLSQHVPAEILWSVITEGMKRSGLGFDAAAMGRPAPERPRAPDVAPRGAKVSSARDRAAPAPPPDAQFDVGDQEVAALFDRATGKAPPENLGYDVTEGLDDEMPPIPEEGIIVEEVNWDDDEG